MAASLSPATCLVGFVGLYYLIGAVAVFIGWRNVRKNNDDGPAIFTLGFGAPMLWVALQMTIEFKWLDAGKCPI